MRRLAALLFVCLFASCYSHSQTTSASITGFVFDQSKALVPNATIIATNTATNAQFETKTDKGGSYVLPVLPAGPYRMEIGKPGFKTILKEDLDLHVQSALEVNFQMAIGSASESITITGSSTDIQMDGTVSTVIDRQLIESMPLNGKDMQTLFELSPGTLLNAGGTASKGGGFSVDGQRPTANYLTIDGASGNAYVTIATSAKNVTGTTIATSASGGTNGILPIDAIEEYRMDTSTYTAENGRTPGGQIQVRTRSGTNEFHGTVFENFRNQILDAKDWFVKYNNIAQSQLRMNDFGGTFGGPILRNRVFFFGAHDTLVLDQPVTATKVDVPNQALRQSAAAVFQPFLAAFPLGNGGADPSQPGFDIYNASQPFLIRNHTTSIRLDSQLRHTLHVFFRANIAPSSSAYVRINGLNSEANIYTYTGGFTAPISKGLVNDLSINRTTNDARLLYYVGSTGDNSPDAVIKNLPTGVTNENTAFAVNVGHNIAPALTSGPKAHNELSQWNAIDTLSWQYKKHTIKFGADFLSKQTTINQPHLLASLYLAYSQPAPFPNFQNGIADILSYTVVNGQPAISIKNLSLFANDSWRVSSSFVFNIGLRWEYNPAASIGPLGVLAVQGTSLDPATITAGVSKQPLYSPVYDNFAPRLGFAWTAPTSGKFSTVLRGGLGTYFDTGQATTGAQAATATFPYQTTAPNMTNVSYQSINWSGLAGTVPSTLPTSNVYLVDRNLESPRTYEWGLTLEQSLGKSAKLATSYVGNDGERLIGLTQYYNKANSLGVYPVNTNVVAKNSYLYLTKNQAHSNYQALQMQFTGRMSNRFDTLFSYTWAHAEDNGSTEYSTVGGAVTSNPIANSAFDVRHAFAGAIHYTPAGVSNTKILHALTSGWSIETIARLQTSTPFTVTVTSTNPNAFLANADVVPGQPIVLHEKYDSFGHAVPGGRLLNFDAFTTPPTDSTGNPIRQGNSPTYGYRMFGLKQWDLGASRSWQIYDRLNVNFRVDAFNILNMVNFSEPVSSWAPTYKSFFGIAGSTYAMANGALPADQGASGAQLAVFQNGGARSLQLSAKLRF
ncbi:MAG: carboxypeptidase-like regulatory domain-containing protein [Edaphobacter sp.]